MKVAPAKHKCRRYVEGTSVRCLVVAGTGSVFDQPQPPPDERLPLPGEWRWHCPTTNGKTPSPRHHPAKPSGRFGTGLCDVTKPGSRFGSGLCEVTKACGRFGTGLCEVTKASGQFGTGLCDVTKASGRFGSGLCDLTKPTS